MIYGMIINSEHATLKLYNIGLEHCFMEPKIWFLFNIKDSETL